MSRLRVLAASRHHNNMRALHPLFAARAQTSGLIVALTKDPNQLRKHCVRPRSEGWTNTSPKSTPPARGAPSRRANYCRV